MDRRGSNIAKLRREEFRRGGNGVRVEEEVASDFSESLNMMNFLVLGYNV